MQKITKSGEEQPTKPKKVLAFGAVSLSLFIHVGLFLLAGSAVIVQYAVPRNQMVGDITPSVVEQTDTTVEPEEPVAEPDAVPMPETSIPQAESTPEKSPVKVDLLHALQFQGPSFVGSLNLGEVSTTGSQLPTQEEKINARKPANFRPFGDPVKPANVSLEGVLYDLKQTKDRKPNGMNSDKYVEVLKEFIGKNWNKRVLNDFFHTKRPLYATQIYIPRMEAAAAPKAFEVEKDVKPSLWIIVYEGSFKVPESGLYRFAGFADDVLVVRVNDKVVLDGSIMTIGAKKASETLANVASQQVIPAHKIENGLTAYSEWIPLEVNQTNKIEILMGEWPGGFFCSFLFIQSKDKEYLKEPNGRPILPIFRMESVDTDVGIGPAFDASGPIFGNQ